MHPKHQKLGILVGGGPAPGINSVIAAATIRSVLRGVEIMGIQDGFEWIMQGDCSHVRPLTTAFVSRIHFRGGSTLGTSRANPTTSPDHMRRTLQSLSTLGITGLITIGGDDTAFSAMKLEEASAGALSVVHVPKTIDNDLCLPHGASTFGFQTARHLGVDIVKNLMVDARTTARWYLAVTMGRKAGHLALGIGKAASAPLILIPEAFRKKPIRIAQLAAIVAGAMIKRLAHHRRDGVVVLAEGLLDALDPDELSSLGGVEHDAHGNVRFAELDLGKVLKTAISRELQRYDIALTIVPKNIGYELRCADPIPYDIEYTRDLGYCAAQFLLRGGSGAMVTIDNGRFAPSPFHTLVDPQTGKTKIRLVDIEAEYYQIAQAYMIQLDAADFHNADLVRRYANCAGLSVEEFTERFHHIATRSLTPAS